MAKFLQAMMITNQSVAVSAVITEDLPVHPLSHALVTLKFAQNQADTQLTFANILATLTRIEVLYKGSAVYSLNGLDAFALGRMVCGFESWGVNATGADNDLLSFTFLVPFGRRLFDPKECYPASMRGELQLQLTFASAFTQIDGMTLQVSTFELLEAAPERYMRCTTLVRTPTATGDTSIDLPIGNKLSDIVLWGTTIPLADASTTTIQNVRLQVDNVEQYYTRSFFEGLHNSAGRRLPAPGYWAGHIHQQDAAAFAQYQDSSAVKPGNHVLSNHLWMPIDINRDGEFALDTRGLSDLELVIDAGDTNPLRVIPCEIVSAGDRG
ncbi:MAG: hypothetical protein KAT00_02205 [Planctomycetes bacterium]|nr:hypothetical protein [Planctomycetota bacterium]MCK5645109.1 hypothetical protein [Gammaproteobacteria bacterium]